MNDKHDQICADCGSTALPVEARRGTGWVEIILWLFFLIPGLIYSIWRRARSHMVCAYCGNPSMVSIHSERARKITRLMKGNEVSQSYYKKPLGVTELKPKTIRSMKKKKTLDKRKPVKRKTN
ncbi:MAG: hypothetical protein G3M70_14710 [Candidatus Nitronauta litoralis]|uniref:YqaE/Pmp3 family membrane protein n=1 Tax=Candidatus Nitronauta litoralis TaxID=2705533 RepID=A0A7T0BY85_9BACT|nr:MAG: hypothetical protein G3M70_14710 [Candidatus Nitronauta litoralis]